MAEMWVCGDCRSTNNARSKRCYRCRLPRATSELTEATAAYSAAQAQTTTTILAAATRLGVRYRPSWPVALLAGILILGTTGLDVLRTREALSVLTPDGTLATDPTHIAAMNTVTAIWAVGYGLSGIAWSVWMALLVSNVPALTARWPSHGPIGAFFALWIPFIGLKRPYSIVKQVTTLLSGASFGPALLVIAWWLTFLASFYLPTIVVFLRALGGDDQSVGASMSTGSVTRLALVIVAAVLAALVLVSVEYFQRLALERRTQIVFGAEGAS
jgi:hypothetical protein